jgi:hypothetical protein
MTCAIFHARELVSLAMDAIRCKRSPRSIEAPRALGSNGSGEVPAPKEGSLNEVSFIQR